MDMTQSSMINNVIELIGATVYRKKGQVTGGK